MSKQKQARIIFDEEDYSFIMDMKEAMGGSLNHFVSQAIKEKIQRIESEQYLKDQELINLSKNK